MNIVSNLYNFCFPKPTIYLSKSDARRWFPYVGASCTSFNNDELWIREFGLSLLSPNQQSISSSSPTLKAHDKCFFDRNSGLKISLVEGKEEIIVAFGAMGSAKTEVPLDQADAATEIQKNAAQSNLLGYSCDIYEQAAKFVAELSKMERFHNKKIVLCGQSLGGSLAQYAALKTQFTSYCFNPIPLGSAQIARLDKKQVVQNKTITVISVEGDYATALAEHRVTQLAGWIIATPKLYGNKMSIPSAYSDLIETHSYFMGSFMKYLGYDIRTRLDSLPKYELCLGNREEMINQEIKEVRYAWQFVAELEKYLEWGDEDKARGLMKEIQSQERTLFQYLSFVVWLANKGRDFHDICYGENRLLNTPSILNHIKVDGEPLLKAVVEHFATLLFIKEAKLSFHRVSIGAKEITKEILKLPFISEMKREFDEEWYRAKEVNQHDRFPMILEADLLRLLKALDRELYRANGSVNRQQEILKTISEKYPKFYLSLLILLKERYSNLPLDYETTNQLVQKNPFLLYELSQGKVNLWKQLIEYMDSLYHMQKAIDSLIRLKVVFQDYLGLAKTEGQVNGSATSGSEDTLFSQLAELETFFSLVNDQKRLATHFEHYQNELSISSKEAIQPRRIVNSLSLDRPQADLKRIFMVTAEYSGVIKVGGLAEAVRGIADGLKAKGYEVTLIMPKYDIFPNDQGGKLSSSLQPTQHLIEHTFGDVKKVERIFVGKIGNVDALFIEDTHHPFYEDAIDHFSLKGNELYQFPGDVDEKKMKERFAYFGQAAAELIKQLKDQMDVVFFHDWHGALAVSLLAKEATEQWLNGKIPPLVYVFHNNGYSAQGMLDPQKQELILRKLGLPLRFFNTTAECLSTADHICTVSESYALEVQGREGNGLQQMMRRAAHEGNLSGVTNGCNLTFWNPETDKQLVEWIDPLTGEKTPLNFGADRLEAKKQVKIQLHKWLLRYHPEILAKFGLDVTRENLILFVGRYDSSQKGIDKLRLALRAAYEKGATFIAMGFKEDPIATQLLDELEKEAEMMKDPAKWGGAWIVRDFINKANRLNYQQGSEDGIPGIGYLIRAAANMNFCPSEYEPCGLSHLEGFPYSQCAIATNLGGYADIICTETKDPMFNGFLFPRIDQWKSKEQDEAILFALRSAIDYWNSLTKEKQNEVFQNIAAVAKKFSWTTSPQGLSPIEKYEKVMIAAKEASTGRKKSETLKPFLLKERIKK